MVRLERRPERSRLYALLSPLLALALTCMVGAAMFVALGKSPVDGLYTYFVQPLVDPWLRGQLLAKATPLILIAVGLAVCFRSGNWNIGAEGQYLIGGMAGTAVPVMLGAGEGVWVLPLVILFGMAGGALYAAIPAILKSRFGANEILTSLMLVYVAQQLVDWIVRGPWRNPQGFGFPGTISFPPDARLPKLYPGADAHFGLTLALLAGLVLWFVLSRTTKGFEVTVLGQAPRAGRFAGFDAKRMTIFAFLLSGAMAGLAGIAEVSGTAFKLDANLSLGYGFTAIIVAFLGRLNPLGIVVAGFVLALTIIGGEEAQIAMGISDRASRVFQGLILFFVLACDTLMTYRIRIARTRTLAGVAPAVGGNREVAG